MSALPIETLVDPLTGVIRSVKDVLTPEHAPAAYTSMTASVADARHLGDWPADRVSLGTTFGDPAGARIAAIGEAVERYCGNYLPETLDPDLLRVATRRELRADGLDVIALSDLPSWADWQTARPGFEYTPLTEGTPTLWARCRREDATACWWPSAMVHLNWRQRRFRHLPRVLHLNYAGIATGQGVQDATDRAVLEILERDALEVWWHLGGPTVGVDPDSVPGLAEAMAGCPLTYWIVDMPSEYAPCMGALVHDRRTGIYAAGFSCKLDPAEAARKAVLEAVHTWIYTQGTTAGDGWVFRAIDQGLMARGLHLEHRADGLYLDAAGPTMQHVRDLGAHVQVWQDPRTHHLARRFTDPARGVLPIEEFAPVTTAEVYERLRADGREVHTCDLTTSDVAQTSLRVVRALIPGLVPNAPAAFTYLGCPRFAEAARARGWGDGDTSSPEKVTRIPAPHM
ncbi:ribosomal protein S12 methylthiotransferase accessory factor [Austwickia chelonae]|uniref:YcaO domain-containing protein n=1 Tax=Austwickia chelonae NBRC 105200 TaxID=1184607 RepID=K6ULA0_9MICO|nr:YcaO-like family protein [Austwickia chelonae]GAB77066.1 hypothetical protein AUCHE_04_01070 [Austwickia chelonae NBRC 105200]SEW33754.1 ribosomal protein S12 methylthiotransferase accessory factor [Austwickia chelonae]